MNALGRLIDSFIHPDLMEFSQREDLERARIIVGVLLVNIVGALFGGAVAYLSGMPAAYTAPALVLIATTLCGYVASLFIFRATASFLWGANLFGLVGYPGLVASLYLFPEQDLASIAVLMLLVPMFITLMLGVRWGIPWALLVGISPPLMAWYRSTESGIQDTSSGFLAVWWVTLALMVAALYGFDRVQQHMRRRLDAECARFAFQAAHDPLTGLANRATFDRRLEEALEYAGLHGEKLVLLSLDLNDFKPINDTHGHPAGDALLVEVARRLKSLVRASDTVARLGGDEFAVIFPHVRQRHDLDVLLSRIAEAIAAPVVEGGLSLQTTASTGIATFPENGREARELVAHADALMYRDKQRRKAPLAGV